MKLCYFHSPTFLGFTRILDSPFMHRVITFNSCVCIISLANKIIRLHAELFLDKNPPAVNSVCILSVVWPVT